MTTTSTSQNQTSVDHGHVWRKISTFRGYGVSFRQRPEVGDAWKIMPGIKLLAPRDEDAPNSPMMSVGSTDCYGRVSARVVEIGAHWTEAGREGWYIRFALMEPAVDHDGKTVPSDLIC